MYHDLQINRLRALVTVVDLGGFRRAADALHITQPAVSQQIRQLSALIKGPIFMSTGRDLRLSPRGEELLGYARRIVALNDEAVSRFLPSTGRTRLSIGIVDQLAEALPEILRLLAKGIPQAQISVQTGLSETLESQTRTGQLDMALLLQPLPMRTPATMLSLGHLRMDWFGRPAHRDGDPLPLTLFTEPCNLRRHIVEALNASDIAWRVGYEGDQLVGLRAAAKVGLGVTCLVANGDELWGLPKSMWPLLPSPPGPIPVAMALSDSAATANFAPVARRAFQGALDGYPFAN
jgi:DNA-binding transcriptional LysR family regulator